MSYELIAVIVFGITQVGALVYLRQQVQASSRQVQEQLRRNLALETQFQKWNTDQSGNISQRLDEVLQMLRADQL